MHNSESVAGSDFVFHSVQMILYRLLGQAELVRNFLVRQALRDKRNDLLVRASSSPASGGWLPSVPT
jgi:hypothetical protein